MAFTLNRRLSTLVDSSGQLKTGKIPNDYITGDHIADNVVTTAMLHTGFTLPISSLTSIDTDDVTEGSTNLFYTTARVDSHLSGGTGVTYSSGAISIGQAVATSDSPTFADLTITGNLNITGDINSYNVTDLDVTDQTITLGAGQIEANSGGSGIIIDGSNASILWDETNDQFDFNKGINVDSNTLVVDGTNNRVGILNAAPDVSLDLGSATDGIHMPVGTTAQRPSSPAAGYFRYNSDDGQFEGYTTEWGAIAGSGGASAMETNNFTGDGSTTAFTLSSSVSSEDNLIVFIEGIYQNKGDYVASGTTLTFDTAPVNGRRIVVQHILSSVAGNSTLYTSLTGDGSTTAFTLSGAPGHENNTQVFMDGVYQQKDSYIVNGTTLTFDAAPANNAEIEVMSFAQTTINQPGTNTVSVAELNLSDGTAGQVLTTDGNGTISFSTVSGTTINNNADNRIITGSGTANTLEGESGLTYDGSTLSLGAATGAKRFLVYDGSGSNNLYAGFGIDAPSANDFTMYAPSTGLLKFGKMATDGSTITTHMAIDNSGDVTMSSTGALKVPSGTTAQRPSSPANGMLRYNTTLDVIEEYRNGAWEKLSDAFSGSGGIKSTSGSYTYHTFNSSGSIVFTGSGAIDILVVAGGGGGGDNSNIRGSGGGAGGLIFISSYPVASTTYTVSVGSGGAEGASGTNSVFSYSGGTTLTALGGGVGGYNDSTDNGADGGSGGGQWYPGYTGASGTQPANTNDGSNTYNSTGFGNDGGTSGGSHPYGSGGGGAGAVGASFNTSGGPVGGAGKDMSATFGTSVGESGWFAGGGGSGSYPGIQDVKYDGGQGGGGRGWNNGTESEQNGTANTGGGGGAGGSGGSGIVILRYLT